MLKFLKIKKSFREDHNGRPKAIILQNKDIILITHPYYSNGKFRARMYEFENISDKQNHFLLRCKDSIDNFVIKNIEYIIENAKYEKTFEKDELTFRLSSSEEVDQKNKEPIEQCNKNDACSFLKELFLCNPQVTDYGFLDNDTETEGILKYNDTLYMIEKNKHIPWITFDINTPYANLQLEIDKFLKDNDIHVNHENDEYFLQHIVTLSNPIKNKLQNVGRVIAADDEILIVYKE